MTEQTTRSVILVCDDDALVRHTIAAHLSDRGHATLEATDGVECLELTATHAPDATVLDLSMPRMDGLTALGALRERGHDAPVVVITATGGIDDAIAAVRLGAQAWLQKPIDVREVGLAVQRALDEDRLKRRVTALEGQARAAYGELIGQAPALQPLLRDLKRLETISAPTTVLILGESGTGKDIVARMIHAHGPRKGGVFVEVDCTTLPDTLFESELFGHERGAFTGAATSKRGLLEVAAGGVVFLDEIGELSASAQAKLLRALENRTFKRVGGVARLRLDASVIAATNRDLRAEVEAGRFREDLYYRLDVVDLRVPPLRERREDIPRLVRHFISRFNARFRRNVQGVTAEAMGCMLAYPWPGNVRELKNMLERLAILDPPERIGVADLPAPIRFASDRMCYHAAAGERFQFELPPVGVDLADVERDFIIQALEQTEGSRNAAADLLGISRFQLRTRIKRYGLDS